MFKLVHSQREFMNVIIQVQRIYGGETDRRPRHIQNIIRSGPGSVSSYPLLCKVERDIEETEGTPRTITLVCPRRKAKELIYWRTFNHVKSITSDLFLDRNPFIGPLTVVMNRGLLEDYIDVAKRCFLDELDHLKSHSNYPVEADINTTNLNARTCVAHKMMPVIVTCCRGGYANQGIVSYWLYFFVIGLSTAKRLVYHKKNELAKALKARSTPGLRHIMPAPVFRDTSPRSVVGALLDETETAEDLREGRNRHNRNFHINTIGIGAESLRINECESIDVDEAEPSESSPEISPLPPLSSSSSSSNSSERGTSFADLFDDAHLHTINVENSDREQTDERSEDDDRSRQANDTLVIRNDRIVPF